jgi:penicillin-binding protein-related factor A (putative recombinase)
MSKGKQFELVLREDWKSSMPKSTIDRLYDSVSGYKTISNISDFIAYKMPYIFYLEAKTIKGNTFPFQNLTQYDKLTAKVGIDGVRAGVVIWFYEHDKVIYVPISTITRMKQDGKKSINIKTIDEEGYRYVDIPSVKKRVFMTSDYSVLMATQEGE